MKKSLKFILTLALIMIIVAYIALSPLFDIKSIVVSGAVHYTGEDITAVSGIFGGENGFKLIGSSLADIFTLRIGGAEKQLKERCPYIKTARVSFVPPSKVDIDIQERTAYAVIMSNGTSIVLDREGYILEMQTAAGNHLPVLKGLQFKGSEPGSKLTFQNPEAFDDVLKVLDVIQESDAKDDFKLYNCVDAVDVGDLSNFKVSLDSRVVVNLGDLQDLNYKINETKTIYAENLKKDAKGILDFTMGEYPVFRPESEG